MTYTRLKLEIGVESKWCVGAFFAIRELRRQVTWLMLSPPASGRHATWGSANSGTHDLDPSLSFDSFR